ncbi:hypothetical protein D9M68_743020 [compost metagenome]
MVGALVDHGKPIGLRSLHILWAPSQAPNIPQAVCHMAQALNLWKWNRHPCRVTALRDGFCEFWVGEPSMWVSLQELSILESRFLLPKRHEPRCLDEHYGAGGILGRGVARQPKDNLANARRG